MYAEAIKLIVEFNELTDDLMNVLSDNNYKLSQHTTSTGVKYFVQDKELAEFFNLATFVKETPNNYELYSYGKFYSTLDKNYPKLLKLKKSLMIGVHPA